VLVAALSLNTVLILIFGDQRLKPAGFDEAAHWLGVRSYLEQNQAFTEAPPGAVAIWDRYMGYAAAMGLATTAIKAMPMGAEDDRRAWSAYGGQWREVRVSYPLSMIIWGRSPLGASLVGLLITGIGAGSVWLALQVRDLADDSLPGDEVAQWVRLGAAIAIAVGVLIALWGIRTFSIAAFGSRVEAVGEIVRRRSFKRGKNQVVLFLAFNDGKQEQIKAWRVNSLIYNSIEQGDVVKTLVSPRLGYVHSMSAVSAVPVEERPTTNVAT
jgi:hypothetical protein